MHKLLIVILLSVMLVIAGCDFDDADTLYRKEIRNLMYEIALDFSLGNTVGIMDKVHWNYLHNGDISYHFNQELINRMGRFSLLDIDVIYIELQGDYALVHTIDRYSSSIENVSYNEPETKGWMSYLKYERDGWMIYGNQQWISLKTQPETE